ncbi:MAG: hypothetical protein A3F46_01315, partial [Legionellales bacterium RIFCSPHIGHO2_12_FULL_42_9]
MKRKTSVILFVFILILCGVVFFRLFYKSAQQATPKKDKEAVSRIHLHRDSFKNLPGWFQAKDQKASFLTFQVSCRTLLRQNPDNNAGSQMFSLKVKDWYPACQAAAAIPEQSLTNERAKVFFEQWFSPVTLYQETSHKKSRLKGLFTGYYMPFLHGSLVKTTQYNVPIYGVPDNLITVDLGQFDSKLENKRLVGRVNNNQLIPFYTRAQIDHGALKEHAPIIAWTDSMMDRLNLEIQGSGVLQLPNDEKLYLGYAMGNGAVYTPVARVLIENGVLTRDTASMQAIRAYFESHPKKMNRVIHRNKSFVFFRVLEKHLALGAQGVGLTSGYSLAVDRQWIPMGVPIWLSTTHPDQTHQDKRVLQRLMIAQ